LPDISGRSIPLLVRGADGGADRLSTGETNDEEDEEARNSDPATAFSDFSFRFIPRDNPARKICIRIVLNP
jgi:hypothetical protein